MDLWLFVLMRKQKQIFLKAALLSPLSPRRRLVVDIKMLGDNIIKLCIKM